MPKNTGINLQGHDLFVRKKGELVYYYPGHKCTCGAAAPDIETSQEAGTIVKDSLRARAACSICRGNGYWWSDYIKLIAICTDINVKSGRDLLAAGWAAPGDMLLTPPPLALRNRQINDMGKVVLPVRGGFPYEGDVIIRDQYSDSEHWDYTAYPVLKVDSLTWHDPDAVTPMIINCEEGTDFSFVVGEKKITWLKTAKEPPYGTPFCLSYRALFEWIVFTSPTMPVESGNLLGGRILLRRKHTIGMA